MPKFRCLICNSKPTKQKSHHTAHKDTEKHKSKRELFNYELSSMTAEERLKQYNSTNIEYIIKKHEDCVIKIPQKHKDKKIIKIKKKETEMDSKKHKTVLF